MRILATLTLTGILAALTACASQPEAPAPGSEAPKPAPEPAAPTPAPKAVEPAVPASAALAPEPAAPAPAVPAVEPPKKKKTFALGLPTLAVLKEELGLDGKQSKSAKAIYDAYKPKLDEAVAKVKEATDKKAANREIAAPLRTEVLAKLREVCADDAQKAKFDALTAPPKKKPASP